MNAMVTTLNGAGRAFVDFAVPMLVQSSVLILILLAVDSILRKRVRAVFRYWIWLLVLVKLVLPPSLWSPVSLGTWFGDKLAVPAAVLLEPRELPPLEPPSRVANILSPPDPMLAEPPFLPPRMTPAVPPATDIHAKATVVSPPPPVARPPALPLSWQGLVLLVWAVTVAALLLLLAQRAFFVRGLARQAGEASRTLLQELAQCRTRLGLRREIGLKLSPNATTPAVCGLIRPVILIPRNLAPRLRDRDLQAVLLHELAHVKRGDLWINLAQTLLQIVYFYHPLLWLANAIIRRIREKAVDETVLVAMGETAAHYPQTLLNVAKLALARRPALSLRLIGVVESKSALTGRIAHILNRPIPKTARLGLLGILVIVITATVLLPMAKGNSLDRWLHRDRLVKFETDERPTGTHRQLDRADVYSKEYQVTFRQGERLLVVAELYQTGRPMQTLGHRVFPTTTRPEKFSVSLRRQYVNAENTAIRHDVSVRLGREAFHLDDVRVETPHSYANTHWGFFTGTELKDTGPRPYYELENLLLFASGTQRDTRAPSFTRIWIPGYNNVTWVFEDVYFIMVKMLPVSQLDHLQVGAPELAYPEQLPDGSLLPGEASKERRQAVADEYVLNLKRLVMRDRMPLPKLVAHAYYSQDEPLWISIPGHHGAGWKPSLAEIHHGPDFNPCFLLIDGKEYTSRFGFGPFDGGGTSFDVLGNLYLKPGEFHLSAGKHTVAYGWKNLDVVDPNDPDHPLHFARLTTDPVTVEVVEQLPPDYYRPVYQEGWEDILRRSLETHFTDDMHKYGVYGTLLTLKVNGLPFDTAFTVHIQAEGSTQSHRTGELARTAGSGPFLVDCARGVKELSWETVGDKRWRIILKPAVEVAKKHPPIHEFYGREFVTDWVSFERSPQFEQHRREFERHRSESRSDSRASAGIKDVAARDVSRDSDGDGLSDFQEIHKYLTDPAKKDSDGDGTPDGDWSERREYAYSVRTVLRYMPPFDEKGLNDDFQDGRVLQQTDEYVEVEFIHYPFATAQESIPENRNWRQDYARMSEFLAPGASTNWDQPMQRDLLAALKADGIDVETLSDKQVVERVSRWLLRRSRSLDKAFTTWFIHFPPGKPAVYPGLEDAFRREFERDSSNYNWTLDQHLEHEVLGKGMFYNKTHGSCTSTAVYLTTVLRALGIPTRMILVAPAVDPSDRAQILLVKEAITHHRVRMTMLPGLNRASRGTTNHIFNEVYVGNRWCRLDYSQLGCSSFGLHRLGLQTHLYTFNDLSDANLAPTWGRRYAKGERNDVFRHDNPYTAVEVSELFGPHGRIPNLPCTAQELDSHPKPDVFLFCPSRANVWTEFVDVVADTTFNKTARPHDKESYENLFDGIWLVRPQDFVILLFSLDTPERVPEGYEDLLPQPWPEIEAQLKQGQTVELSGKTRGLNVIVLAAPTAAGLKPLVQNSRLLRESAGAGPVPSVATTQQQAISWSAGQPVKLDDSVMVELLGVCEHPSEGKQWWRPDGSPRETAPYRAVAMPMDHVEGDRDYEFAVRISGPSDISVKLKVPGSSQGGSTNAVFGEANARVPDLQVCLANCRFAVRTANLFVGVASSPWRTAVIHKYLDREGSCTLESGDAIAFGIPYDKDGSVQIPVTTNILSEKMDCRLVALDEVGGLHVGSSSGTGGILRSSTCRFDLPLSRVRAFEFRTRPWTWVAYKGISLRAGEATAVTTELLDTSTMLAQSERAPGEEMAVGIGPAWEVLRDTLATRYAGSIGGFGSDHKQRAEDFEKVLSWARPGDALVLMLAFDQSVGVPVQFSDLLPLSWTDIESRIRQGQTVEAQGKARDRTVIFLAAPTTEQLNTLVRQTHLLDPFRPESAKAPAAAPSSPTLARLPNDVTVELLGVCNYPSEGKQWWRADGSPLGEPPYDKLDVTLGPGAEGVQFEFAVRVQDLPPGGDFTMGVDPALSGRGGNPLLKTGVRLENVHGMVAGVPADCRTCTVKCAVAPEPWRTVARSDGTRSATQAVPEGTVMFTEARPDPEHGTSISATYDLATDLGRLVAIRQDGKVEVPYKGSSNSVGKARYISASFAVAPAEIKEYQFQIRSWTSVEFENVALRPGLKTDVQVQVLPADTREFDELSVKFSGLWIWWQRPQFAIQGDGSVTSSVSRGPRDATRYETQFRLRSEHQEQLTKLLRATDWLTAPGADKDPGYIDTDRLDIRLTRHGESRSVALDHRNPEPYLSLVNFLQRLKRQEFLLSRIVVGEAQERLSAFREIDQDLRSAEGEPVVAPDFVILDYDRFVPTCLEVIDHTGDNHHDAIIAALKLLARRQVEQARRKITELTTAAQTGLGEVGPTVRTEYIGSAAVQALAALGGEQARARIRAMAKDHRRWPWGVNNALVEAVLAFEGVEGAGLLRDMLISTQNAGWGLIRLGPDGVPAIVGLLQERPTLPDWERIDQIHLIRQYLDHWDEVPKPVDARVLEAVRANLDYRLGRSRDWTEYHRQLLQLAGIPEPRRKSATEIAGAFLQAVKSGNDASIDALVTPSSTDWPDQLNQLQQLPNLKSLQMREVYVDRADNLALLIAANSQRPEGPDAHVALGLNFISGAVWRVGAIAIQTAEQTERMVRQFRQNHPNAVIEPNDDPSDRTAARSSPALPAGPDAPSDKGAGGGALAEAGGIQAREEPYVVRTSAAEARLPNSLTVELLGLAEHPSAGKPWWRPNGEALPVRPYDRLTNTHSDPTYKQYEIVYRVAKGTGQVVTLLRSTDQIRGHAGPYRVQDAAQTGAAPNVENLFGSVIWVERDAAQTRVDIAVGSEDNWQTHSTMDSPVDKTVVTGTGVILGPAIEKNGQTLVTISHQILDREIRLIAVDKQGALHKTTGFSSVTNAGFASGQAEFDLPVDDIASIQFQTQKFTWVLFQNVSLNPGLRTQVKAEYVAPPPSGVVRSPAGGGWATGGDGRIVLPVLERQPVLLDLATGEFIPVPPAGPEPQKIDQALRKLGRGDLLYDYDLGDGTLILVRGATSEQAQENHSEPSLQGYLVGPQLPATLIVTTAEGRSYKVTILAADDKTCTLKYSPVPTDQGAGGGALARLAEGDDILGFRIAPTPEEVGSETVAKSKQALTEGGPPPGSDFAWFEVRAGAVLVPGQITCEQGGKSYLLLWNDRSHVMRADGSWGLEDIRETRDEYGRRSILLTLDDKGVQLLHGLARANLRHYMAIVFEGRVIAVPHISTPLSGTGVPILGQFTAEEVDTILAALRRRMVRPGPLESGGAIEAHTWQDVGAAIPPDVNDTRTLAPGVVLEGSGADVEEKAFVSCLRDILQTAGRQYRFVLVTQEGKTLEPVYYTSLPRGGGQVWEKYSFDAAHLSWKLSHFQLQSRPIPPGGRTVAPAPREEILVKAAALDGAVASKAAPPGRYGLSFDGRGDYLYIPDSESLRQAPALTIEMWIKPQLPPGPHTNRPRWGLLGYGCCLGTGHVTVSGFGIKIDGFDPATKNLMIDYGEAVGDRINCTVLGKLFSNDWIHISHTFDRDSYRPAPGHPLVVGRYLIPSEESFPGQIGEIRLWAGDGARYANAPLTGKEPGLVACWTFEEGRGPIAHDISPNANHARLGSSVETDAADPTWVDLAQDSQASSGPVPPERSVDAREKMNQLALAIVTYAGDHNGDLPPTLSALAPYTPDSQVLTWLNENVIYIGKGTVNRPRAGSVAVAYEKTPQPTGERHILFLDYHIEPATPERFRELGLENAGRSDPATQPQPIVNALPSADVPITLGGDTPLGLFYNEHGLWFEVHNRGADAIEISTSPVDQDESRRGEWGYVEVLTEAGQPAPYVWRGGTPNLWKVEPRRRYKVNSFLNGMPLRKSGPGTYRVRLTLRIRNVRTNESTFVSSDWHTFRVTPAGRLPGQARGPYEEFQEAEAYAGTCDFGHGTRQDAIRQLLALAQKYPGTKYALAAYFSAANQADALANETGDAAHAAQRREYFREIMARWPDVVHYHTIYARLHVQWGDSTSEFLQSRRNTYQWLLSLTEEQKIASVKEYASLLPGTLTDEDVPRFLPGLNKYIAQTQKMLEESIPGLGADVSKSQAGPGKVEPVPAEISGRLLDPAGRPAAGAQVALCTKDKGVIIQEGQLVPTTWGGRTSAIASTDAEGRFTFSSRPEEFHLVAAHEQGFAWVIDRELTDSADLRLVPWARIEGTLRIGREVGTDKRVSLLNFINKNAIDQGVHFEYRVETDGAGRFAFARVPPTWMEVGYMVRVGDSMWTDTSRTPIHLQPGQSLTMTLGGEGRPVVGRFVPPADYRGPVYFGAGLRAFATQRPDLPRPADYDRMTQREQQEWLKQWSKTPAAEAFYNVRWHDLNRRHYSFRIENDGLFRIEDVIPGEYQFTVWLEERFSGSGHPQEIGGYYGPVDVPPQTEAYTDEPLDLGDLTLKMRSPPLHVGDPAPLFETQTLDGNDIRLLDYRGKFVLLSFWQPTFHPELDRLKELQQTYGVDRLAILDFAVSDTLAEVESYIREHQIEWPEIYLGETKDNDIAKRYGDPVASYILLVDPEGKIVATWLREEKLTEAVQGALGKAD